MFRESTLKQWLDMILTYIDVNVDDFRVKDIAYISKYIAQLDKYNNSINDLKKD